MEEELSSSTVAHPGTDSASRVILTIVNDVGPTSMPFNEFVVYRAGHVPGERHVVISWGGIDHERLRVEEQHAARKVLGFFVEFPEAIHPEREPHLVTTR